MITITIEPTAVQAAMQKHLDNLLTGEQYRNPIASYIDELMGRTYSSKDPSPYRQQLNDMVNNMVEGHMKTPEFQLQLGNAIATQMAIKAVEAMEEKKRKGY